MDTETAPGAAGDPALAARVLRRLSGVGATVATAESITGGQLARTITDVPGASQSFLGGVVAYATELKVMLLDVAHDVVAGPGVVSAECAVAMADGVRRLTGATYGLSTTGVAGPGRQEGKAVGTVYVGVAGPGGTAVEQAQLAGDRGTIRSDTCAAALTLLLRELGPDPAGRCGKPAGR